MLRRHADILAQAGKVVNRGRGTRNRGYKTHGREVLPPSGRKSMGERVKALRRKF